MAATADAAMCCACLSIDRRTFPLGRLSATYHLLCEATSLDTRLCWECRAVLDRLRRFRLQVSQAQYFITCLTENRLRLRGKSLSRLQFQNKNAYYLECKEEKTDPSVGITETVYIPINFDNASCTTDDGRQDEINSSSLFNSEDKCVNNITQSLHPVPENALDEDVRVLVLSSSSNDVLSQNMEPAIGCVITNNLDNNQLEIILDRLKHDNKVSVLKEISLKRPAELLILNKIKNKLLTYDDMLDLFGLDWQFELENIKASNQQLISVDQWLLDKANLQTHVISNCPHSFKPKSALNHKHESLKPLSSVSSQFKIEPLPMNADEWIGPHIKPEGTEHITLETQMQETLIPLTPVFRPFKTETEQINQNKGIESAVKLEKAIENNSVNIPEGSSIQKQETLTPQLRRQVTEHCVNPILVSKQLPGDTTEQQHIHNKQVNKDVPKKTSFNIRINFNPKSAPNERQKMLKTLSKQHQSPVSKHFERVTADQEHITKEIAKENFNVSNKAGNESSILHVEMSKSKLVPLDCQTLNANIQMLISDDEDVSWDDGAGYQDDGSELTGSILAIIDIIERDGKFNEKGKPDNELLDKLDPMDQFGVRSRGTGITNEDVAKMKTLLKEGKVELLKVTIDEVDHYRKRPKKPLKGVLCQFCNVRLNTNLDKHLEEYHSDVAGPHVCAICSRHFITEEEQRTHYQRHFYMYRCKLGCISSMTPSIWQMVSHIKKDEWIERRRVLNISPYVFKKGPDFDDAALETLDASDRFGKMATSRKINGVKQYEEDGKVERFVATLNELMEYRKMELHQYDKNCVMCVVKIPDEELEEHKTLYHTEAAGTHVCDICNRYFRTEEAQRAHYQRHFNMYRCRLGDCRYATPSIKKIWRHISMKELKGDSFNAKMLDGKCDICGGIYLNRGQFMQHYRQHISKERYECDVCGKVYNTRRQILVHMKRHDKKYMCEQCGYRTDKKMALQTHAASHMTYEERQFKCSVCSKLFTTLYKLKEHGARCHGEKTFLCAYCESVYGNKYELNIHVKRKHPDKVTAAQRNKRTKETQRRTKSAFRNPWLLTPTPTSFPCDVCGKEFDKKPLLNQHSRVHIKLWPFKCDECGEGFALKRSLEIHLLSHKGDNPYECDKCDKKFKMYTSLKWHREYYHGHKRYECAVCGLKVKYPSNLTRHMQKHSG